MSQVWLPTEPSTGLASLEFSYNTTKQPFSAKTQTLFNKSTSTYLESWQYVDGFGRGLQTQRASVISGNMVVSSEAYNNVGQLRYSSTPYRVSGTAGNGYVQPTWSSLKSYQEAAYDKLGRQTEQHLMTLGSSLWHGTTSYDGWTTTQTDANNHPIDHTVDAFGQLVQVKEFNTGAAIPN